MPLPMVHLSVAWNLDNNADGSYYIGSIAPDAINLRKNRTQNMKRYSHMMPKFIPMNELDDSDRTIMINNAIELIKEYENSEKASFFKGYGIHILTDLYWSSAVYKPYLQNYYSRSDSSVQNSDDAYYNDTDQCDLMLYNKKVWRKNVWERMSKSESFDVRDYISAQESEAWKKRTFDWFDSRDIKSYNEIKYINIGIIEDFIKNATITIRDLLESGSSK